VSTSEPDGTGVIACTSYGTAPRDAARAPSRGHA
jgi:hypothetical protein